MANGKKALNMVSFNFLGVAGNASIKVHFPALKCSPPTLLTGGFKCYHQCLEPPAIKHARV
jgi:hypothetical protein